LGWPRPLGGRFNTSYKQLYFLRSSKFMPSGPSVLT
jgi:hypothetical protein